MTGSIQSMFFDQFIKDNSDRLGLRGFLRKLEDGRIEIFIEGNYDKLEEMIAICKRGSKHAQIRNFEEREEKFQDFKDFRILKI